MILHVHAVHRVPSVPVEVKQLRCYFAWRLVSVNRLVYGATVSFAERHFGTDNRACINLHIHSLGKRVGLFKILRPLFASRNEVLRQSTANEQPDASLRAPGAGP